MGAIFKPQELSWEDIEGGVGESMQEAVREFISEYAYGDYSCDSDETLIGDIAYLSEEWEKLDGYGIYDGIASAYQTAAVLSLIQGAFGGSWVRERIMEKFSNSATKPRLVEIMTHVASAYCQYIALKARVEIAEACGGLNKIEY